MESHARLQGIDISAMIIPPETRSQLRKYGFKTTADFQGVTPSALAKGARPSVLALPSCHTRAAAGRTRRAVQAADGLTVHVVLTFVAGAEAQISMQDAADVLRTVRGGGKSAQKGGKSALEMLQVTRAPARLLPIRSRRQRCSMHVKQRSMSGADSLRLHLFVWMLQTHSGARHIITFCSEMDAMLGGGVALGEVTEFCGAPGKFELRLPP
jgi:hypothetical protein